MFNVTISAADALSEEQIAFMSIVLDRNVL